MRSGSATKKLVIAVGAIAVAIPTLSGQVAKAAPPATPTFNPNLLLAGSQGAGEPSIKTDSHGTHFVIGPTGFPTGGCHAFRVAHDGSSSHDIGFPDSNVGGGDCDWAIGPKETSATTMPNPATDDNLAYSSLLLSNIVVGKSSDGGNSFTAPNTYGQPIAEDDRMWNVADTQNNAAGLNDVFMTYHDLNTDELWQVTSTDGGVTYNTSTNAVIVPSQLPALQWEASCPAGGCVVGGPAVLNGNELGNIVARRTSSGLTLYTIFTTPDSAADNQSGTGQNRVFEAVGTVVDNSVTKTPQSITWNDYEIWRDPVGTVDTKIFPVTSVDANGNVYAFWSDAKHIYEKSSADGIHWGCTVTATTTGNCDTFTMSPQQIDALAGGAAALAGANTAIMPWVAAGANGAVDLVWYGAHGGAGGNENDPNNIWDVYFAQTIDGFNTWSVTQASDHDIHKGVVCTGGTNCTGNARILSDFFQVDIDPTTGAADIAWTDDHLNPGSVENLYYTRQCTGASATTLLPLTNDCVAPPPPPPPPNIPFGTTCPGPQILDPVNDAPNNYPGGTGQNMDNLDILNARFNTAETGGVPSFFDISMTIKNLTIPPDPTFDPNLGGGYWSVNWTYNGNAYEAQASSTGSSSAIMYTAGPDTGNEASAEFNNTAITGTFTPGANGIITFHVPVGLVGNPPHGALLTKTFAATHGAAVPPAAAGGVYFTAAADYAPSGINPADPGFGADYLAGLSCLTLATTVIDNATGTAWTNSEQTGATAHDTVSIGGQRSGVPASGTVTYRLFSNGSCLASATSTQTVPVNGTGGVPDSNSTGPLAPGSYAFKASYSGDGFYDALNGACEQFTVHGWRLLSISNPTGAKAGSLSGVACPSSTLCIAVGNYTNSSGAVVTLAESWNGASWSVQSTPNPTGATSSLLRAVACASKTQCTAVGYYTTGAGGGLTLAERWNGTTWAIQSTPNPAGAKASLLAGVACPSSTLCTAVGYSSRISYSSGVGLTLAERWSGGTWAIQSTPNPTGATSTVLRGVSCPSTTLCTAVGSDKNSSGVDMTVAERWSTNSWAIQSTLNPTGAQSTVLRGVGCASSTLCTAVGNYVNASGASFTLAERWNGSSWAIQASLNPGGAKATVLNGVACASSTVCTAVGNYTSSSGVGLTLAQAWNGSSWAIQSTPNPSGGTASVMSGVACSSTALCTGVGNSVDSSGLQITLAEQYS